MHPKIHFLVSALLAFALFPIYKWLALMVFIGGFLLDIDHIFFYYQKTGELSLLNTYRYHKEIGDNLESCKGRQGLFIFHNIELLLIFAVLSFFSPYFLLISVGIFFHYLLDFYFEYSRTKRLVKYYSAILFFLNNRTKRFKY